MLPRDTEYGRGPHDWRLDWALPSSGRGAGTSFSPAFINTSLHPCVTSISLLPFGRPLVGLEGP